MNLKALDVHPLHCAPLPQRSQLLNIERPFLGTMSDSTLTVIAGLRATYIKLTGFNISEGRHQDLFYYYHTSGFTEQDLSDVLTWMVKQNAKNDYKYSLRLSSVIADLDLFDERRAEAQRRRPAARSDGQKVVDQFRGYEEPLKTNNTMHISEVMRRAAG